LVPFFRQSCNVHQTWKEQKTVVSVEVLKVELPDGIGAVDFDWVFAIEFFDDFVENFKLNFFTKCFHVTLIGILTPPHDPPCP